MVLDVSDTEHTVVQLHFAPDQRVHDLKVTSPRTGAVGVHASACSLQSHDRGTGLQPAPPDEL